MKISITPHEIIERALWYDYQYYVLDKDVDTEKIIEENEAFEISETEALTIGLLKCIETDNLVHRLNQHVEHLMAVRSTKFKNSYYLKKKILVDELNKYGKRFPSAWKPRPHYIQALSDVTAYIEELLEKTEGLSFEETTDNFGTHELLRTNHVKKILNYHN